MQKGLQECWRSAQRWRTSTSGNKNFGPSGAERLAGVLGQCASLAHLDLSNNQIGPDGAESFAGVLG